MDLDFSHVITFDADGQHPAASLKSFIDALSIHDLVLGVRPHYARIAERVFLSTLVGGLASWIRFVV